MTKNLSLSHSVRAVLLSTAVSFAIVIAPAGFAFAAATITSTTLNNGASSVQATSSASIIATVTVTTGGGNDWRGTKWRIGSGAFACVDTDNHTSSNSFSESFPITVPVSAGTYTADFIAYNSNDCTTGASATSSMVNAIVVDTTAPTLTSVRIESSNTNSEYAKAFDTIILSFTSDEPIRTPAAMIAGHAATIASLGGNDYQATAMMLSSDTEGAVAFSISFSDIAGNAGAPVSASTDGSSVLFDRTKPASVASITPTATNSASVTVNYSRTDSGGAGIDLARLWWKKSTSGSPAQDGVQTAADGSFSFAFPSGEGIYQFYTRETDFAGNQENAPVSFDDSVVYDTTAPAIGAHADATAEATGPSGAAVAYTLPTVTDNLDGSVTASCLPASGSTFALGDTTVTCTATDAAGNAAASTVFTVHVVDTVKPVITLNGSASITLEYGDTYSESGATVFDVVNPSITPTIGGSVNTLALGTYTLTYDAADAAENNALQVTRTVNVVPKAITVIADQKSKTYGDVDPALTYSITSGSLVGTDSFSGDVSRAAGENVGTYAITQGTLALSGNYALTYVGASLTVNERPITVTADAKSKIYGDADPALTYSITSGSLVGTDAFSGDVSRAAGENVGAHAITQDTLALSANYTLTYVGADLTITRKAIIVTADAASKVYGDADPVFMYTTDIPLISGDTFSGNLSRAAGNNAGLHAIDIGTLTPGGNYDVTFVPADLTITTRPITVSADSDTKVYDGTTASAGAPTITSGSLAFGDTAAWTQTFDTKDVGTDKTLTPAGAVADLNGGANYAVTFVTDATGAITPAPLDITANDDTKVYGETKTFAGTAFTASGLQNGETVGTITLTSDGASASAPVSSSPYSIVPSAATGGTFDSTNYAITYTDGELTVTEAALTITPNNSTKIYGDTTTLLGTEFMTSGLVPGDSVTSVTLTSAGEPAGAGVGGYPIIGSAAMGTGLDNYTIGYDTGTLTVTKKPLSVSATGVNKEYDGTTDATVTFAITGVVGSDVVTADGNAAFADKHVGTGKTVNVTGITLSGADAANYSANDTTSTTADITTRPITVSADSDTKVYDGTTASAGAPTITSGSLAFGDTAAWTQTFDTKDVGTDKTLTPTGAVADLNGGANYAVTFANDETGGITPLPVTATAEAKTKTYGTADPALTYTVLPALAAGDSFSGALTRDLGDAVGSYAIGQGTLALSSNYTLSFAPNSLTITPAPLTITANDKTKTYGETVVFADTEFSSSGLLSGDSVSNVTLTSDGAASGASVAGSPYDIVPGVASGSGLTNYAITYANGHLTVNKATPVITWATPADVAAGTALSATQLNATADTAGVFTYTPPAGTVLTAVGSQSLTADFAPSDSVNYNNPASVSVPLNVYPAAIAKVTVAASPSSLTTADASTLTVNGRDQFDNITTNQSGSVVVISADNGGALDNPLVTLASGVATAHLTKSSAGTVHVTVSSGVLAPGATTVTFTPADTTGPAIVSVSPSGSGVAIGAPLYFTTGEALKLSSVNSANIQLWKAAVDDDEDTEDVDESADESQISAAVSLVEGGKRVNITPDSPLSHDTAYHFVVTSGVTDEAGNALTTPKDDSNTGFTTAADTADRTAPTITAANPADSASGASIGVTPSVTFSEPLMSSTVSQSSVRLLAADDTTIVPSSVSLVDGGTRAILTPTSPLSYSTIYHVAVSTAVTDEAGNALASASETTFTTATPPADTTAPAVSNIQVTAIGTSTATITWTTDEASDSQVEYGHTSAYGNATVLDAALTTSHSVTLTGLTGSTGYHFRVKSADAAANQTTSGDNTFTTTVDDSTAVLAVTGIDTVRSFATADNTFDNGWKWTYHVTVPTSETQFKMKFSDFTSGANSVPAATNIRFYSAQSSDASSTSTAKTIIAANTYSDPITLNADLTSGTAGRQIDVTVEMRVPASTAGGSYSGSYGIFSSI